VRWDPETSPEPPGWYRHRATGRRRIPIVDENGRRCGHLEYRAW